MATLGQRGSGTPATNGATWTTVTNAVDGTVGGANPATYAVWTSSVTAAVAYIEVTGYNFAAINDLWTLNSVTVTVRHIESSTSRIASVAFQAYAGATPLGSLFTGTLSAIAHNDSSTFPVTLAQLKAGTFKVRVTCTRAAGTQSSTFSVDHVDVVADYTIPTVAWAGGSTGTIGVAGTSDAFILGPAPTIWTGSEATIGVLAFSGEFILPIEGSRTLESDLTRRLEDSVYRLTEELGSFPQTWSGSTGTVGIAGTSAAFVPGPVSWSGDTATVGTAGISGSFIPGGVIWGGGSAVNLWEPFDNLTTAPWTTIGGTTPTIATGRTGTAATFNSSGEITWPIPALDQNSTVIVGFAYKITASPGAPAQLLWLWSDTNTTQHTGLRIDATRAIVAQRSSSLQVGISAAGVVPINTWCYIEARFVLGDSPNGAVTVRVDDISVLTLTGIDTRNSGTKTVYDTVHLHGTSLGSPSFDDLYVSTGAGAPFQGDITVPPLAGDIASLAIAGTSGSWSISGTPQTWSGSTATIGVTAFSGSWFTAGGPQTWASTPATLGVAGISGAFVIAAPATGTRYTESNVLRITEGNIGRNLEGVDVLVVIGLWNGQDVYELMYGSEPVEDWVLV